MEGRVAGDVRGGKGALVVLEDSDDDGRDGEGGGLLALSFGLKVWWQREAGAVGMELGAPQLVARLVCYNLSTPPRNVASNGNDDHVDRREKAV